MHYGGTVVPPFGVYGPDRGARDPLGGSGGYWRQVTVLGAEVYNWLQLKPPVRTQVTMLQAGDGACLKGFIAGPFGVMAGQSARQVDLYVAPLKDSMLLGMDFLPDHKAKLDLDAGTLCFGTRLYA